MNESQYIDSYLDTAADPATRWTPHTFLSYRLAGKAKDFSAGYHRALTRAISRRTDSGTVTSIRSKGGSTAYVRTAVAAAENRAHTRALLSERQPGLARELDDAVEHLRCGPRCRAVPAGQPVLTAGAQGPGVSG